VTGAVHEAPDFHPEIQNPREGCHHSFIPVRACSEAAQKEAADHQEAEHGDHYEQATQQSQLRDGYAMRLNSLLASPNSPALFIANKLIIHDPDNTFKCTSLQRP
jgi:hypothetical protein